jgi:uncharacterized protein
MGRLIQYQDQINSLCAAYSVKMLYAFGSVLTPNFNDESDIDFIVVFDDQKSIPNYAKNYFNFQFSLENLLKREVDVLEEDAIKNPFFKAEVFQSRTLIYEQ